MYSINWTLIIAEKCYAFIEYESPGDAHEAIHQLNKTRLLGLELKVELTKYKRTSHNGLYLHLLYLCGSLNSVISSDLNLSVIMEG